MKSSFCIDLQRFMLIPTKFPLTRMLSMSEVQRREELSKGIWQTLYGFPMVVAICFRLNSNGAAQLRDAIIKRLYGAKEKTNIVLQLYGGTNSFS